MKRIGAIGTSWRQGGEERLAPFVLPHEERAARLVELSAELAVDELVYLATCHRVELYVVVDRADDLPRLRARAHDALAGGEAEPGEAERVFRAWAGEGAAEHLFLVACGLDSARVGETEIASQVRDAHELSRGIGLVGPRLERVFGAALRTARRVQTETALGEGRTSLAEIALDAVRRRLREAPGRVALVGVTAITERCARELAREGVSLVVANRTVERARALAAEVGAEARSLDELRAEPGALTAILSATGAGEPVLDAATVERAAGPAGAPLVVDMAIPADLDPAEARARGIARIGMDEIVAVAEEGRERRLVEMAEAREHVDRALVALRRELGKRLIDPALASLQAHFRDRASELVERALRRELGALSPADRDSVRGLADALARKLAHAPTAGLRRLALEHGSEAVETFFEGAGEELEARLRDAIRARRARRG